MKFFVTGANGFVGKFLCEELERRGSDYLAGTRASYGDLVTQQNWEQFLQNVDIVVHLAARVHVMKDMSLDPLVEFRKANCEATLNLAKAAKLQGVKRFIYISSVKVNGETTTDGPFYSNDEPAPQDAYGISKMEAERGLLLLNEPGVFEVVIIRPPLVYGPGVKANFQSLMTLVHKGFPLPFGLADKNKRSLVSVYNLVDLIILCSLHEKAGGQIFLVSDDNDLSLKKLIQKIGFVLNRRALLIPIPIFIIEWTGWLLRKGSYVDRLFGNLQVDISQTKRLLGWTPKVSFEETFNVKHPRA